MGATDLTYADWRKSSRSGDDGGDCVEVAGFVDVVAVRDSKNPQGPALVFTTAEWRMFLNTVKSGRPPATADVRPSRGRNR